MCDWKKFTFLICFKRTMKCFESWILKDTFDLRGGVRPWPPLWRRAGWPDVTSAARGGEGPRERWCRCQGRSWRAPRATWTLHCRGRRRWRGRTAPSWRGQLRTCWKRNDVVALTFSRRYKRSNWRFCACAINVKSLIMCSEMTMHLWYIFYGLFVRMYI